VISFWLSQLMAAPAAQAQQHSPELQARQETTRALYPSGAYTEARKVGKRIPAMVISIYGPEHEQTNIQARR
jgi:hypothetical protein